MGSSSGPNIVQDNLILYLDSGNKTSYPESGTTWTDLSSSGNNSTLSGGPTFSHDNMGTGAISGGTVTTDGDYIIHTFINDSASENFITNVALQADVLIVAGGGGGGMDMGGGGGAGGLIYNQAISISSGTHAVVVGSGGAGGPAGNTTGQGTSHQFQISATNGENTTAFSYTAIGGGYGASSYYSYSPNNGTPNSGGSGGGTSGYSSGGTIAGAAGTAGQGNAGGQGGGQYYSGGGGGAGAVGVSSTAIAHGGIGRQINIDGNNYYWAGGGGGAAYSGSQPGGNGGAGGGGGGAVGTTTGGSGINAGSAGGGGSNNSQTNTPGGDAGANTGGGGGGGSHYNYTNAGGDGGSGIVIIRYHRSYAPRNFHLDFDGSNDGGLTSAVVDVSTDWTIECWVNLDDMEYPSSPCGDNRACIWGIFNGYWNGVGIEIIEYGVNKMRFMEFHGTSAYTTTYFGSTTPTMNVWYHVTVSWDDSGNVLLYWNGEQNGTRDVSAYDINPSTTMYMNRYTVHCGGAYVNGRVAIYRAYNKALSAAEVLQNFNAQKGRFGR